MAEEIKGYFVSYSRNPVVINPTERVLKGGSGNLNPLSLEVSANRLVGDIATPHWWRIGTVLGAISFKGIGDQVDFDFRAVAGSFFIHAAHGGEGEAGEDGDDADDDEEFYEGKRRCAAED